jgi:hypothetical protein
MVQPRYGLVPLTITALLLPVVGLPSAGPASAATHATHVTYQDDQRINGLTMQFGTSSFAPANALGSAIASAGQSTVQNAISSQVTSGSLSLLLEMIGLADLTGTSAPTLSVGVVNGAPSIYAGNPATYNGNSDLDWWYAPSPLDLDSNGIPKVRMSGSIASHALTASAPAIDMHPSPLGSGDLHLSSVEMVATTGASSAPLESTNNLPPGHLPAEKIPKKLVSFASMSSGQLRGNVAAVSLQATPVPAALISKCNEGYTTANSLLDVLVNGCKAFGFQVVNPTQPDQVDPNLPPVGAGGPYRLVVDASKVVSTCLDKNSASVPLAPCLDTASYSAYFTFTTDRVIVPPPPRIALTPGSGPAGTAVRIDGSSFRPAGTVKVTYKTGIKTPPTATLCSATVQADGTFTCNGMVPTTTPGPIGPHLVLAAESAPAVKAQMSFSLTAR